MYMCELYIWNSFHNKKVKKLPLVWIPTPQEKVSHKLLIFQIFIGYLEGARHYTMYRGHRDE